MGAGAGAMFSPRQVAADPNPEAAGAVVYLAKTFLSTASDSDVKEMVDRLSPDERTKLAKALAEKQVEEDKKPEGSGKDKKEKKELKEWTKQEVTHVMKIFVDFDHDKSGTLDKAELGKLCELLMIEEDISAVDKLEKDGKIGEREFFQWYVGCTKEEADKVFKDHAYMFAKAQKKLKEWTREEVVSVLALFKDLDADDSGTIDKKEICDLLVIDGFSDTKMEDFDKDTDGKVTIKEFFKFYTSCEQEEMEKTFIDYAFLFAPEKDMKKWSEEQLHSVLVLFEDLDADGSGYIDPKELCDLLMVDGLENTTTADYDKDNDGKISMKEFFSFYAGATKEETEKVFEDHADIFKPKA